MRVLLAISKDIYSRDGFAPAVCMIIKGLITAKQISGS